MINVKVLTLNVCKLSFLFFLTAEKDGYSGVALLSKVCGFVCVFECIVCARALVFRPLPFRFKIWKE